MTEEPRPTQRQQVSWQRVGRANTQEPGGIPYTWCIRGRAPPGLGVGCWPDPWVSAPEPGGGPLGPQSRCLALGIATPVFCPQEALPSV